MKIDLVNQSQHVAAGDHDVIVAAAQQCANDWARGWDKIAPSLSPATSVSSDATIYPIILTDQTPDDGTLGEHDEEIGRPSGHIFVDYILANAGNAGLFGAGGVLSVVAHEVLELAGDPFANFWADAPYGKDVPLEMCDACEGCSYALTIAGHTVFVSDWLYPAWFDPDGKGPFDLQQQLTAPFQVAPGGYVMQRDENGNVTTQWGDRVPRWFQFMKGLVSRAVKRGAPSGC